MTLLNVADQALLIDIIISVAGTTINRSSAEGYFKLAEKVKNLELERVDTVHKWKMHFNSGLSL